MISTAQKQMYLIKGRTADQHVEDTYQESLSKSADARNAISKFIDYLPANLINKYNKHEEQYLDMIRKIYEGANSQEEIIAFTEERTSLSLEIIDLVDSILAKKLNR
jgi:hypothetical protein